MHLGEAAGLDAIDEDLDRYRLLASALAGRSVRVERSKPGELSHTDGRTIFVADLGGREGDLAGLAVQAALLACGSLAPELARRMSGRPGLANRYLAVEGWRALAAMAGILPGVPIVAEARRHDPRSSSPEESLQLAIGRTPLPDPPELFGVIRPRRLLNVLAEEQESQGGAPTPADLARRDIAEDLMAETDEDDETESIGKIMKLFQSPLQSPLAQWLSKKMGAGRDPGDGAGGADLGVGGARRGKVGARAEVAELPAALLPNEVVSERGPGWCYPEWNTFEQRYQPDWTTVIEVDPRPDSLAAFDRPPPGDLRRRLARLGVGLERRRRQPQGEDLDVDAIVSARIDLASGISPADALYIESQRRKRSLAVLVLLDVSGSAGEKTAGGDVHRLQRAAAARLVDALHVLGDRVALYGFRSQGRGAVYLIRLKAFDDPLDGAVYERLGGLTPGSYTRLGAAIRHGAWMLDKRAGTDRRLLVVLSDGFAYDDGYEGRYGESDARKALLEARKQGVGCLCLSLGATNDVEALKRVFGTAAHASAREFDELLPSIGRLFRRAMASADLQRRLAQRDRRSDDSRARGVA